MNLLRVVRLATAISVVGFAARSHHSHTLPVPPCTQLRVVFHIGVDMSTRKRGSVMMYACQACPATFVMFESLMQHFVEEHVPASNDPDAPTTAQLKALQAIREGENPQYPILFTVSGGTSAFATLAAVLKGLDRKSVPKNRQRVDIDEDERAEIVTQNEAMAAKAPAITTKSTTKKATPSTPAKKGVPRDAAVSWKDAPVMSAPEEDSEEENDADAPPTLDDDVECARGGLSQRIQSFSYNIVFAADDVCSGQTGLPIKLWRRQLTDVYWCLRYRASLPQRVQCQRSKHT